MQRSLRSTDSPVGRLVLAASPGGLTHLKLESTWQPPQGLADGDEAATHEALRHLDAAETALAEYFAGARKDFDDLTLVPDGTSFQQSVWSALRQIPFGATESYGALAKRIDRPGASRAVGMANNRNPIGIIVPCHRVIGSDGRLVGYAGGLEMKQWLLGHEGALEPELFRS